MNTKQENYQMFKVYWVNSRSEIVLWIIGTLGHINSI